jgi:glycosyltransferase involved in cell wall biosynthesis
MPKPLKILVITSFFHPHPGGSQRYLEELYVHLITQHPEIKVDVLCYNTDAALPTEKYRGLTVYRIPCWQIIPTRFNLPHPLALFNLLKQLSSNQYDFVHTHLRFFDTSWWAWYYARKIKARSIFTEHVASTPVHQSLFVRLIAQLVDATLARWTINCYDTITATNESARQFLMHKLGIKKPISVVYGGVDASFFQPNKSIIRSIPNTQKTLGSNDLLVTFVGRLIWTKGVTYLYEAIKQLLPTLPENVYFALAGPGELETELAKRITDDHLRDRVFLTGALNSFQVKDLLQMTGIFVHPSHHNEGFPNVILEAGASECFVIATDNAGTGEIITNQKTGLFVNQKDTQDLIEKIQWVLKHPAERKQMSESLRNKITEKFSWYKIAEGFNQFLERSF